jgi:hypothetical protein
MKLKQLLAEIPRSVASKLPKGWIVLEERGVLHKSHRSGGEHRREELHRVN